MGCILPLEYCHPSALTDWRIGREDAVACQRVHLDPIRDLVILEYPQANVGLRHPPQCRFEYAVPPVLYIVYPKMDNLLLSPYCHSTALLRMSSRRSAHP